MEPRLRAAAAVPVVRRWLVATKAPAATVYFNDGVNTGNGRDDYRHREHN